MGRDRFMLDVIIITLIFLLVWFAVHAKRPPNVSRPSTSPVASACDDTLWSHVYKPTRLYVLQPCIAVTGIIEFIRNEKDGDKHILVKLDPEFSSLVNEANNKEQYGDLVVEPVCQGTVFQDDAEDACADFNSNLTIPPVGSHVELVGPLVADLEHSSWHEIHPLNSIMIK